MSVSASSCLLLGPRIFFSSLQLTELMVEIAGRIWVKSGTFKTWSCLSLLSRVLHCLPFSFIFLSLTSSIICPPLADSPLHLSSLVFLLEFKYLKELLDYHDHLNYFDKNFINNSEEGLYDVHLLINATVCQHFVKKITGNSSRVTQDRDDMRHRNKYTRSMSSP